MTQTQQLTLADFLLARIAEDEDVARAVRPDEYLTTRDASRLTSGNRGGYSCVNATSGRVLAECEARRRIVEQYVQHRSFVMAYRSPRWADAMNDEDRQNARLAEARHRVAEDVVQLLALPYANHPDYRSEWISS